MSDRPAPGSGPGRALRNRPTRHGPAARGPGLALPTLAMLMSLVTLALGLPACAAPDRPSVVLITIDTLRADHLGAYGYDRPVSPHLDALAREGLRVDGAWTTLPRTTPSIASILTGRLPKSHGTRGLLDRLSGTNTTLAEILKREGYDTAAFTSGAFLRPGIGFEQGFDSYDNPEARRDGDSAEAVTAGAAAWLAERRDRRPFFLWVHYLDPLWRYDPGGSWVEAAPAIEATPAIDADPAARPITRGALIFGPPPPAAQSERIAARYDGEIARTDAAVGALLRRLAAMPGALITVMTSDHGESLGEHGYHYAHGDYLYEQGIRIPILVRYPGIVAAGSTMPGPALNIDIAPTILRLAGVGGMQGVEGRPLLTLQGAAGTGSATAGAGSATAGARQATAAAARPLVWSEGDAQALYRENPRRHLDGPAGRWTAAGDGRHKLILIPRPGGELLELYDLPADPGETNNLADDPALATVRARLYRAIKEFADYGGGAAPWPPADAETNELIRSLGYFN